MINRKSRDEIKKMRHAGHIVALVHQKMKEVVEPGISTKELDNIASRFIDGTEVYALIDTIGILNEKESPTDNISKFEQLLDKCMYRLK